MEVVGSPRTSCIASIVTHPGSGKAKGYLMTMLGLHVESQLINLYQALQTVYACMHYVRMYADICVHVEVFVKLEDTFLSV